MQRLLGFVEGLQALDAHMHALRLTVDNQSPPNYVRAELAVGVALGKADIVSVLRAFAAHFTFSHLTHL
jgi:Ethanolamine utilization protein EutJ (predicted chaperonin)